MPIEVLRGQVLSPEDLDRVRADLETVTSIEAISPELRAIVVHNWPHLAAKLPPED
jgi:hypothetical protein